MALDLSDFKRQITELQTELQLARGSVNQYIAAFEVKEAGYLAKIKDQIEEIKDLDAQVDVLGRLLADAEAQITDLMSAKPAL